MGVVSLLLQVVCIILIMFPFTTVYADPDYQVKALMAFKDNLVHDAAAETAFSSWIREADDPCTNPWFHVTCVSGTDVIRIDLGVENITGPLDALLGNLTHLQILVLSDNHLAGPIPPEWGNLTQLTQIYLQNNQLTGRVPDEWTRIPDLIVDISRNEGMCGPFTEKDCPTS